MMIIFAFVFACGGQPPSNAVQTPPAKNTAKASTVDRVKLAEALKIADAADGKEDKIAHKCAGCALSMDGSADHSILVDGVTLHLCSAMCKTHFSADVGGNVLKLLQ